MDKVEAAALFYGPRRSKRSNWALTAEQAAVCWPEAMVVFDQQCSHLVERGDVLLTTNARGRLAAEHGDRVGMRTLWHRDVGVWVRYSCSLHPPFYSPGDATNDFRDKRGGPLRVRIWVSNHNVNGDRVVWVTWQCRTRSGGRMDVRRYIGYARDRASLWRVISYYRREARYWRTGSFGE